jgi:hypothetical protein
MAAELSLPRQGPIHWKRPFVGRTLAWIVSSSMVNTTGRILLIGQSTTIEALLYLPGNLTAFSALHTKATSQNAESITYASAGVSIDAGNDLVQKIKAAVKSTRRSGTDAEIGGFGGTFDLEQAGYSKLPILVGAIDGVGTKLKVAQAVGKQDTVGKSIVPLNLQIPIHLMLSSQASTWSR